jgi:NitT/TauT family transport system permease protein
MTDVRPAPLARPEIFNAALESADVGRVARPLSVWELIAESGWARRGVILGVLGAAWEVSARALANPLLVPPLSAVLGALWNATVDGTLVACGLASLGVLLVGYGVGIAIAAALSACAVSTRLGADLLGTLTAMFNPLPAIALVPLALVWFGLGVKSLVFVIAHAVAWPLALATFSGFQAVPETMRMAGRNCGLSGLRFVALVLVPAAFPAILAGLKIGWAFAWRTLIAAEVVFGAFSRSGGLGRFIDEKRHSLETAGVFAGLIAIVIIGLVVEGVVFRTIEERTVRRWGMQR